MADHESWENTPTTRVVTRVETSIYAKIKKKFHHGQMTQLMRNVIYSIAILIKKKKMTDIVKYIHQEKSLTLPIAKKEKD